MQIRDRFQNILLYRFIAINVFAVSLLAMTAYEGWFQWVFQNDTTRITSGISILFLIGIVLACRKAFQLNWFEKSSVARRLEFADSTYNSLMLRGGANLSILNRLAVTMLLLGICGTVVGLMIALSQVNPAAASDVALVGPMAATLLHGVSIKLSTTLFGIVGNIWTTTNYHLLSVETQRLIARICEERKL